MTTIKHLVFEGGGPSGLYTYGAAKYLSIDKFWNISDIQTIYGTSIGAFLGVLFSLKYDWATLDDYIIKRPWDKMLNISSDELLKLWEDKGVLGEDIIRDALSPLIIAKDLNIDISLKEFNDYNNIELHMFSVNLNAIPISIVDISYKTHPDLTLITALSMTMAFPFLFKPILNNDGCFVDGGLLINLPLDPCIKNTQCDINEILVFKNFWSINENMMEPINNDTTLLRYWMIIIHNLIKKLNNEYKMIDVPNVVNCIINNVSKYEDWGTILESREQRIHCIKQGESAGFLFKKYKLSSR